MDHGYVKSNFIKEGILEIIFYHPKHNSLPSNLLKELRESIVQASADNEVQVIILKSGGDRTFCAGASFEELISISNIEEGKEFFLGFANVINACRKCKKIIIGRVQGKAVGGGVGLASAVDYCMATKFASIKLSELNIGIGPFVIGPAVERKIGLSAFSQITLNANEFYTAEWALSKGLFTHVSEDTISLDEEVLKTANYLISTSPEARAQLKETFWENYVHWDDLLDSRAEKSGHLVLSKYTKEALQKFS